MKKILFYLSVLLIPPSPCFADMWATVHTPTGKLIQAYSEFQPETLLSNAVKSGYVAGEVEIVRLSDSELKQKIDADYAPDPVTAQAQRLSEIKQQAVERFKGYELYADMQSVIDYKAALRAVPTTAATEMAALPDVASVKNYQPTWPAKPNL